MPTPAMPTPAIAAPATGLSAIPGNATAPMNNKKTTLFFIRQLLFIRYLPDKSPSCIIRYINRSVRRLRQTARTMLRSTTGSLGIPPGKIVGEDLPFAGWLSVAERHKDNKEPFLRLGSPVPGTVERDKRPVLVLRRELAAGIKQQTIRRKMTGERHHGILRIFTGRLLSIPAIFGSQDFFMLELVVKDLGIAAVGPLVQLIHTLGRQFRTLLGIPYLREQVVQLVAAMLHDEQGIGHRIPV
jgi:hypothetical protein